MAQKRVKLFGLFIDDISISEALGRAEGALKGGGSLSFITPNLEILHGARISDGTRDILNMADVALPDGVGLCLVSALAGKRPKNRVAGIEFGEALLALCAKTGASVYFLGGAEGVAETAAKNMRERLGGLNICGTHDGYFADSELYKICEEINQCAPDVLIVCRGFPRQEIFVARARASLPSVKVFSALGGSFDVWAGKARRAPFVFQRLGLEWLWRIAREPKRAERFLLSLPTLAFAFKIYLKNCFAPSGIKEKKEAYNQVKTQASRR